MDTPKTDWRGWSYNLLSQYRGELMGIAMLWVLFYHAFFFTPRWSWLATLKSKGFSGVDIFILLSALGLAMSLDRKKQPLHQFYLRRFVRVLPTFWLVVGVYGVVLCLVGRTELSTVAWTLSTLFYWFHVPSIFNWYIPALLVFYLITPLCYFVMKKCRYREVLAGTVYLLALPLSTALDLNGFGYLNDFVFRLPVFFVGLLMGISISEGRRFTPLALCLWACGVVVGPLLQWVYQGAGIYFAFAYVFAAFCVILCLVLCRLLALLPQGGLRRFLRVLGECSLEIYLLNVIFVLEYEGLSGFLNIGPNHYVYYAVTVTLNILLGIALHRLLQKPIGWLSRKWTAKP